MKRLFIIICMAVICLVGCGKQQVVETTTELTKNIIPEPIPTLPETTGIEETTTMVTIVIEEETTTIEEETIYEQYFEQQQFYYEEEQYYYEEQQYYYQEEEVYYDGITRESIINYAWNNYGLSEEWVIWLIGTTWNEGYHADRYLEYAWACEIINVYSGWSVWDLDCIWGGYYSMDMAYSGYYAADDITLEMVWEAFTDRDYRIVEVDGMIDYYVPGYYLIYDSPVYNCQVWGSY